MTQSYPDLLETIFDLRDTALDIDVFVSKFHYMKLKLVQSTIYSYRIHKTLSVTYGFKVKKLLIWK